MKYFSMNYLWKTFLLSLPIFAQERNYRIKNNDDLIYLTNKSAICGHESGHAISVINSWREGLVKIDNLKIYSKPVNITIKSKYNNKIIDYRVIDIYEGEAHWTFSKRNFYNRLTDYNVATRQKREEKKSIISYGWFSCWRNNV